MTTEKKMDFNKIAAEAREAQVSTEAVSGGFVVRTVQVLERHGLNGRKGNKAEFANADGMAALLEKLGDEKDKFVTRSWATSPSAKCSRPTRQSWARRFAA